MRIALVGLGRMTIPAEKMGSIENIIWQYKQQLEKLGHTVDIYNSVWIHEVMYELNQIDYDFIHLHSDLHTLSLNTHLQKPFCLTSHCGGFAKFEPGKFDFYPAFNYLYQDSLGAPGNIVISEVIKQKYLASGYDKFLRVLPNPVEVDQFTFNPSGNGKTIYIGKIQPRKRQADVATLLAGQIQMDFVGPFNKDDEPDFKDNETCTYLGEWSRQQVHEQLSNYSCLALLSKSEGAPLVLLEALAAGLCVVTNQACSANLPQTDFITVLPDEVFDTDTISAAIKQAIAKNQQPGLRPEIRAYAQAHLSYEVMARKYLEIIEEFRNSGTN